MGASPQQTVDAFLEAEAHDGPVAHHRLQPLHRARHQHALRHAAAEARGRLRPLAALSLQAGGGGPRSQEFVLDSQAPSIPLKTYAYNEIRYKMLSYTKPDEAGRLLEPGAGRCRISAGASTRAWPSGGRPTARRGQGEAGSHVPRAGRQRTMTAMP